MLSVISQPQYRLTETDLNILQALNILSYVIADQLSRLFYTGGDQNRHSQRRLRRLVDAGYVQRLRILSVPRHGSTPHIFALSKSGRRTLTSWGIDPTHSYIRPSEQKTALVNEPFLKHTLASVDVLVAAWRLTNEHRDISLERMLTEQELRRDAPRVRLASGATSAVVPDAFLVLQLADDPPIALAFEVDRGTEYQKRWRDKVGAIAAWARTSYQEAFGLDNLTIATVSFSAKRAAQLAEWTLRELEIQNILGLSDIFLFTHTSPRDVSFAYFFLTPIFRPLNGSRPVSLLDEGAFVP